jgi:hypothetical protein
MVRWILKLCLVVLCLAGTPASAAVVSRDWKTPGDGLLTYDDVNQREWLDLTESRLSMFAGSGFEQRYQNGLLEIAPGGEFDGFESAESSELRSLAQSAGIDVATSDFVTNGTDVQNLINLLDLSYGPSDTGAAAVFGLLGEIGGPPDFPFTGRLAGRLEYFPMSGANGRAQLIIASGAGDLANVANTGMWLFRAVPEPSSAFSSIVGSLFLIRRSTRT